MEQYNRQKPAIPYNKQQLQSMLQSREGQQLLKLLNQDGGSTLTKAARAAQSGDFSKALEILKPLTASKDANQLISELEKNHG